MVFGGIVAMVCLGVLLGLVVGRSNLYGLGS